MLQLDTQHVKYAEWYGEVDGVKDTVAERIAADDGAIAATRAEVTRVEEEGKSEIVTLRRGLADLKTYYEEEVGRLRAQMKRVVKDTDARVADLRAENAALRTALSDKMTRDECDAFVKDASSFRETLEHETAKAREEMDRHRQRWERDVSRVHEDIKDVRSMCDERVKSVDAKIATHEASITYASTRLKLSCTRRTRSSWRISMNSRGGNGTLSSGGRRRTSCSAGHVC
jgi:DNA-binding ferritin-like protein